MPIDAAYAFWVGGTLERLRTARARMNRTYYDTFLAELGDVASQIPGYRAKTREARDVPVEISAALCEIRALCDYFTELASKHLEPHLVPERELTFVTTPPIAELPDASYLAE